MVARLTTIANLGRASAAAGTAGSGLAPDSTSGEATADDYRNGSDDERRGGQISVYLTSARRCTRESIISVAAKDVCVATAWRGANTSRGTVATARLCSCYTCGIKSVRAEAHRTIIHVLSSAANASAESSAGTSVSPDSVPKRAYPQHAFQPQPLRHRMQQGTHEEASECS